MKPVHIMLTISRSDDVYLPLLLADMSRGTDVPLRISVFLVSPIFAPQVNEMAKIYAQIDHPTLQNTRVQTITCFSPAQPPNEDIDLLLAHSCDDLAHIHAKPRLTILHQFPGTIEAERLAQYHYWLVTPFEHIAHIEIANCAKEMDIAPEDMHAMGCHGGVETFTIYAKSDINAAGRSFKQFETIMEKATDTVFMHALPSHISCLQVASRYLRSWRKEVSTTFVFRATDGTLLITPFTIVNGVPAMADVDEDPDLLYALD